MYGRCGKVVFQLAIWLSGIVVCLADYGTVDVLKPYSDTIVVDQGDEFWLTRSADEAVSSVTVDIGVESVGVPVGVGDRIPVQFAKPGEYPIMIYAEGYPYDSLKVTVMPKLAPAAGAGGPRSAGKSGVNINMGSLYAGYYVNACDGTTGHKWPFRMVASQACTASLRIVSGGSGDAWSGSLAAGDNIIVLNNPTGDQWVLTPFVGGEPAGGTQTININTPYRLGIDDIKLTTNTLSHTAGALMAGKETFALTNAAVTWDVVPNCWWTFTNVCADLFLWTGNGLAPSGLSNGAAYSATGSYPVQVYCNTDTYGKSATVTVIGVRFDLDVNADADIDDAIDGTAGYLPGFEGSSSRITWGRNGAYRAPQKMNVLVDWGTSAFAFDQVKFTITKTTFIEGFCMNSQSAPGLDDDYSFKKTGDQRGPETAVMASGKAYHEFFCKDFGGYSEVKAECIKNSTVVFTQVLEVPRDENNNEIADAWFGDSYDGTAPMYDGEAYAGVPSTGDGLTRFEEYRGFLRFNNYARMSVVLKELFVYRENRSRGIGDGPPTLAWLEYVTADEMNGALHDDKAGTRNAGKLPRIVNFFNKASAHRVDQHGLWVAVTSTGNDGNRGNWGLCRDNNGGASGPIGPPETAGRVEIYARNIRDCCGPVRGRDFRWNASSRRDGLIDDIASHEVAHGLSCTHPADLADLAVTNYPADFSGTGRFSGTLGRPNEGGDADGYMRYRFSELYAAIAGDLNLNGTPNEAGESPDTDWTPTVSDATTYGAAKLAEIVIDDGDE